MDTSQTKLERGLFYLVALFGLGVWAIIGLLAWVFVLARMTTVVAALAIMVGLNAKQAPMMGTYVQSSIGFYPRGFRRVWDGFFAPNNQPQPERTGWRHAVIDSAFTILFWVLFLLTMGPQLLSALREAL